MIVNVPRQLVPEFWPMVESYFARALAVHPHLEPDGLRELLTNGLADLIVVFGEGVRIVGAVAMGVDKYPAKSVGNVIACGVDVGAWKTHGDNIEAHLTQWCKARNLSTLAMLGRAGWSRFVKRHGWHTQPSLVAWKELHP